MAKPTAVLLFLFLLHGRLAGLFATERAVKQAPFQRSFYSGALQEVGLPESLATCPWSAILSLWKTPGYLGLNPSTIGHRKSINSLRFVLFSVLLLSGDVEINPGPVKHPCKVCDKPVKSNQRGILCECCYYWLHAKCLHMKPEEYDHLTTSDESWCCPDCMKQALPFHDCSNITDFSNSSFSISSSPSDKQSLDNNRVRNNSCSIYYSNCRSILPKIDNLRAVADSQNPDILVLTETWLDATIKDHEIFIPNYSITRRDRSRHGGGLIMYIRDSIPILSMVRHPNIELILTRIQLRQGVLMVGLLYRPPSSAAIDIFAELDTTLFNLPSSHLKSCVIVGDFNVDLLCENPTTPDHLCLSDVVTKYHLQQVVSEPTRVTDKSSTLIDHVYISETNLFESCCSGPPLGSSDHNSVSIHLTWSHIHTSNHRR